MLKLKLKAEKRKILGRKVKKLRKEGVLPANIYGKKVESYAVKLDLSDFEKVYSEAGETGLVDLVLGKKKVPVLIHNIQVDPVSDRPVHVDFLQVNLKEKVTAQVPVELLGEAPAEKQGLGTVVQYVDEIEVEALPTDLPEKFELSLSVLKNVDDAIQIKDIKADAKKVEIKDDKEKIVVLVEPLRKEEAEVEPEKEEKAGEGEEAEVEPEKEEKAGEGEALSEKKKEP